MKELTRAWFFAYQQVYQKNITDEEFDLPDCSDPYVECAIHLLGQIVDDKQCTKEYRFQAAMTMYVMADDENTWSDPKKWPCEVLCMMLHGNAKGLLMADVTTVQHIQFLAKKSSKKTKTTNLSRYGTMTDFSDDDLCEQNKRVVPYERPDPLDYGW